ncbi:MAG TPA: hypothetical protein ENN03_03660 [bacterium]|nr:hypothetical protein [bacterium]
MGKRSKKKKKKLEPSPQKHFEFLPNPEKHAHWISLILILMLLAVYFYPVLFGNQSLLPPDNLASRSFRPYVEKALDDGEYPLWNPYIYGGMPSFASLSTAPYVDGVGLVLNTVVRIVTLNRIDPVTHFARYYVNMFLLGALMFLLLKRKGLSSGSALFGSVAMVFLPQVMAYAAFGHSTKLLTVALVPLIFLLLDYLLERRTLFLFCLTALVMGLQLLRAHTQICFYTQFMAGLYLVYWIVTRWKDKEKAGVLIHGAVLVMGAMIMGLLLSSVLNLSVWEYAEHSIRGGGETGGLAFDYATNWSFPPSEIATFFNPSFMGFGRETYWGPMPFTDFSLYFGLVTLMLAGLALALERNRTTWFLLILAGVALFISFGRHFPVLYGPMFRFFPFFNKFRAPKMIHIILEFAMVFLAAYGIDAVVRAAGNPGRHLKTVQRTLLVFGAITGFLFLVLLLGRGAYLNWALEKAGQYRFQAYDMALSDGLRSLFLAAVTGGAVLLALRKKIRPNWLPMILLVFMLVDVWPVSRRFMDFSPETKVDDFFRETPEVTFLKEQDGPFRIMQAADPRPANWYMYHGIQNVWGYQGAKVRIYQELADAFGIPDQFFQDYLTVEDGRLRFRRPDEIDPARMAVHEVFFKMMNVRYVVSPYPIPHPELEMIHMPGRQGENGLLQYRGGLDRVFFPRQVVPGRGGTGILRYMTSGMFDPEETAVVEGEIPFEIGDPSNNRADILEYGLHQIRIRAEISEPSLMVLSEIYYPAGWKMRVNGRAEPIVKADYVLRSVFLQPGTHEVEFVFEPPAFRYGLIVTLATLALLLAGIIAGGLRERKKQSEQS